MLPGESSGWYGSAHSRELLLAIVKPDTPSGTPSTLSAPVILTV